jgi:DNA-binding MurR/RpiR family transcriptional regulator
MPDNSDIQDLIASSFDNLSPKQQALARLIVDNRYFASFASAAEIGEKVDASAATVVRFCQALGFDGLPALQEAIRQELPSYLTAVERLERRLTVPAVEDGVAQRTFATDTQNLQRTANSINSENFDAVVEALHSAREIVVVAAGVAASPALFLAYSLQVMGLRARSVLDGDVALSVNMAHITAEDVVIGISVWRYIRSTVDALTEARGKGACTIAITDSIVSPLARQADFAFEVATEGVAHSLSITAMISLLNALIAGVSLHDPERTRRALRRVDHQFLERGLLIL